MQRRVGIIITVRPMHPYHMTLHKRLVDGTIVAQLTLERFFSCCEKHILFQG